MVEFRFLAMKLKVKFKDLKHNLKFCLQHCIYVITIFEFAFLHLVIL